jgi:glycosyltransferase involved in cell wall biosynthesis
MCFRVLLQHMISYSIIIPCYNQGQWLEEAVASALAQDTVDFELIVINDGSTDPVTNRIFAELEHPRIRKVQTANQGLAAARNEGIRIANGKYLLPLDSDDRIAPSYLRKAGAVLDADPTVGIVYCRAELFGEEQGVWDLEPYSFPGILVSPQIFASSCFRKSDWEAVGGYRTDMIHGWEDYDFWLSLIARGVRVHRLDELLFFYRRTRGSMAGLDRTKMLYSFKKLFEHHRELYEKNIGVLFESVIDAKPARDARAEREVFEVIIPTAEGYLAGMRREQHYLSGEWSRVSIQLGEIPDADLHQVRVDPGRRSGCYDIASIRLLDAATGVVSWQACDPVGFDGLVFGSHTLRLPHERLLRLFAVDDDPLLFLPHLSLKDRKSPWVLEVWILRHPGLGAIQEVVQRKVAEIQKSQAWEQQQQCIKALEADKIALRGEIHALEAHRISWEQQGMLAQSEANKVMAQSASLHAVVAKHEATMERLDALVQQRDREIRELNADLVHAHREVEAIKVDHHRLSEALRRLRSRWWVKLFTRS